MAGGLLFYDRERFAPAVKYLRRAARIHNKTTHNRKAVSL